MSEERVALAWLHAVPSIWIYCDEIEECTCFFIIPASHHFIVLSYFYITKTRQSAKQYNFNVNITRAFAKQLSWTLA